MKKVMFLCTANSCRSQMAEGLAREIGKGLLEVHSAGTMAVDVQPRAIAVMAEIGIDISHQRPKVIDDDLMKRMDYVISLCDYAASICPVPPSSVRRIHWPIVDPVGARGSEAMIMKEFRRARDEIRALIEQFVSELKTNMKGRYHG
ncbi:MAG TPA: arsenate reductase ArsC [Dissulfurispiraceae bacterium]|nr:arsenate reductase ArsC [Dissulfurispiraceae bacterium]